MNTQIKESASTQERFEALLANHSGIVFRVVRTYCRHPEDQQDLAQEIKLQLWRAFPKYDERRTFSTWMYRIALNTAISWTRQANLRPRISLGLNEIADQPALTESDTNLATIYQLIDELDPMNRALMLLYLEDLSYEEIGEVLGITAINVATKISRLKQRLRDQANESDKQTK